MRSHSNEISDVSQKMDASFTEEERLKALQHWLHMNQEILLQSIRQHAYHASYTDSDWDDLYQDVVVHLLYSIMNGNFTYRDKDFSAYVSTIVKRVVAKNVQRRVERANHVRRFHDGECIPIKPKAGASWSRLIEVLLQGISDDSRELLRMRVLKEMTYQEIADATGYSSSQARKMFSRLIRKLRQNA